MNGKLLLVALIAVFLIFSASINATGNAAGDPQIEPIVDEIIYPAEYAYYDYNNDGALDFVKQEIDGNYYVFINKGTDEKKIFREGTKITENDLAQKNIQLIKPIKITTEELANQQKGQNGLIWLNFSYPRFILYIEANYYNNYSSNLTTFFNKFAERYDMLEAQTKWSVEKFYPAWPHKLWLNVYGNPGICGSGVAVPGIGNMTLGIPFPNPGCQWSYWVNGTPYLGNPGELGDDWLHMTTPIHEALHAINSIPIYLRPWLTESFSQYNQYNILAQKGDINQETADHYIYEGTWTWRWYNYTHNDYRDRLNKSIQQSLAYDIGAWMLSMMRNDHSLSWNKFYSIMDNNYETLNKSYLMRPQSVYFTDMQLIDLYGRASNLGNFQGAKPIWRYDGPNGPGWGVKNWTNINYYGDLNSTINPTKSSVALGEQFTLISRVNNGGDTSLVNVPIRIYANGGCNPIYSSYVNVSANSSTILYLNYSSNSPSIVQFDLKVDPDNIKIERNELNNDAKTTVSIGCRTYFDKKKWQWMNTCKDATPYQQYCDGPNYS